MSYRTLLRRVSCQIITLFIIMPFITGCGNKNVNGADTGEYLKQDAINSLKSVYAENYTRLNIIKGALYKFVIDPEKSRHLGTAIGAVEATVFPVEYELDRFNRLENLPPGMRKDIIGQPMLSITLKQRESLNHVYTGVLKPLANQLDSGQQVSSEDKVVLNNLIILLDRQIQAYSILSAKETDLKSIEAQKSFLAIQDSLREMQQLQITHP